MNGAKQSQFIALAAIAVNDSEMQSAVQAVTSASVSKRQQAMSEYGAEHGEALRQQAAGIKRRVLQNLPDLLEQAEANLIENGAQVLWAEDAAEANRHVLEFARQNGVSLVTKSKSMLTEEIELNQALENAGIRVVETDLGEYILQLNNETPSHIVAPVIHKSKESIRQIFRRELQMPDYDDAPRMARYARGKLREDFLGADMGVTGGNFIIAETGAVCLVTNEGNARMVHSMPRIHVALVGIEKIVATLADYAALTQILPRSATGQKMAVYTHLLRAPRQPNEPDGAEQMVVIFVDNGRSKIYDSAYAEALACLRCGACLNICPVYQVTGGHAYNSIYPGPIGSVITPLLQGLEQGSQLPFASSLCGACKEACPVDIDLPRLLLSLRADMVERGVEGKKMGVGMKAWAAGMRSDTLYQLGGAFGRQFGGAMEKLAAGWSEHRDFPQFAGKSFRQQFAEREKRDGQS